MYGIRTASHHRNEFDYATFMQINNEIRVHIVYLEYANFKRKSFSRAGVAGKNLLSFALSTLHKILEEQTVCFPHFGFRGTAKTISDSAYGTRHKQERSEKNFLLRGKVNGAKSIVVT